MYSYNAQIASSTQVKSAPQIVTTMKDFIILTKIGTGAYSEVYKVKRLSDAAVYALKKVKMQKLSVKEKENALNEVRILASINHPSIVGYKEAFFEDTTESLCLVMDYSDDGDLYDKITKHQKAGKGIEESKIWVIFISMVRALRLLHKKNVLHRDLKSANVFLSKGGIAKLGDMNVSKVAKKGLLYTQTGTPYYASPEVWRDLPYDSKSDIWSLGCVLYEMTTLKPPFRANDMNGLYKRVLKGAYPPIDSSKYSKELTQVIARMLMVEPNTRPSCKQILEMEVVKKKLESLGIPEDIEGSGDAHAPTQRQKSKQSLMDPYAKADADFQPVEDQNTLLKTIKVPHNLANLSSRLPKSNYEKPIRFSANSGQDKEMAAMSEKRGVDSRMRSHDAGLNARSQKSGRQQSRQNQYPAKGLPNTAIASAEKLVEAGRPPRGNQPKNLPNIKSMKEIEMKNEKHKSLKKPTQMIRVSQPVPLHSNTGHTPLNKYSSVDQNMNIASQPMSPQGLDSSPGDSRGKLEGPARNIYNQGSRGSMGRMSDNGSNLELQIQQQVALRRNQVQQRGNKIGKDFLNELKLPTVNQVKRNLEVGLSANSRAQNVIERQRIQQLEAELREKKDQNRLNNRQLNSNPRHALTNLPPRQYQQHSYTNPSDNYSNQRNSHSMTEAARGAHPSLARTDNPSTAQHISGSRGANSNIAHGLQQRYRVNKMDNQKQYGTKLSQLKTGDHANYDEFSRDGNTIAPRSGGGNGGVSSSADILSARAARGNARLDRISNPGAVNYSKQALNMMSRNQAVPEKRRAAPGYQAYQSRIQGPIISTHSKDRLGNNKPPAFF